MGKKNNTPAAVLSAEELATLAALLKKLVGATDASTDGVAADSDAAGEGDGLGDSDAGDDGLGDSGDDGLGGDGDSEPEGPSVEDVRKALKALMKSKGDAGREFAGKVLAKFGAKKLDDLAEDKFQACIDLCKKHTK